jgi:hypothetical protein
MRVSSIASIYAVLATFIIGSSVTAQTTSAPQAEPAITAPAVETSKFKLSFDETVQVNVFDGNSTLVGFNQTLSVNAFKDFDFAATLPVYTQGGNTSLGDIDLSGSWAILNGDTTVFQKWSLAVGGGVYIPVGSEEFRSENVNPYINGKFDCHIWFFDFTQTAEYRFIGDGAFVTSLGGKTDSDLLTLVTDLNLYKWEDLHIGVEFDQYYYVDAGEAQLFLGPVAKWDAGSFDLSASVLLPVYQDVSTPEADVFVTAGIGFEF